MLPDWAAIFVSVTLVLGFAEIIPQAVCARYGLILGANLSLLVRLLLLFLYPIAYPISKLLDLLLGKGHSVLLRRAELKTLVDLHADDAGKGGDLSHHETTIITGALDLTQKTAKDSMTPISETFCLDVNSKLDLYTMGLIVSKGHSRIPIYSGSRNNVIGIILAKNLIFCRPEDETPIKHMNIRRIPRVPEDLPLYHMLSEFQSGHSHMAIVVKSKKDMNSASDDEVGKFTILNIDTNSNSEHKKGIRSTYDQIASISITNTTSMSSSDGDFKSIPLKTVIEEEKELHSHEKLSEQGTEEIVHEDLEFLPSNLDEIEEVIGIITMEDVMEELLQGDILDETDEYVAVHNNIRINLPVSRTSSGSFRRPSFSHHLHRIIPDPQTAPSDTFIRTYIQPPPEIQTL